MDGADLETAARITGEIDGTPGSDDMPGRLVFATTADGAHTPTERMRIDASGNVGIGITNPSDYDGRSSEDLVVGGTSGSHGITIVSGTDSAGQLTFADGASGDAAYRGRIWFDHNAEGLYFTGGDGTGTDMVIKASGSVGIGTDSPAMGLHIQTGLYADFANLGLYDTQTQDVGVGGGILLGGKYTDAGAITDWASIKAYKTNDTSTNYSGQLHFKTRNQSDWVTGMVINEDGNVGIGETSPLGKLHIKEGDSGQGSVNSNFDQLVIEDDAHSGITILSGTSSDGGIYFGDSGGNNLGQFKYRHTDNSFRFITSDGGDSLVLDSGSNATFGGNITIGDGVGNEYLYLDSGDSSSGYIRWRDATGRTRCTIQADMQGNNSTYGDLQFYTGGDVVALNLTREQNITIKGAGEHTTGLTINGHIVPNANDNNDLGLSDKEWRDIYAGNATIQSSDERKKTSISDSSLGLSFLNQLRPVEYKWKDYTDDTVEVHGEKSPIEHKFTRKHFGLIAQEVKTVLDNNSIDTKDFAGYVHDSDKDTYGIRYTEFVGVLIKAVQELSAKVEALENA
jgi:hypothetical protein